jgi:iron complex outermembrane receptor protein
MFSVPIYTPPFVMVSPTRTDAMSLHLSGDWTRTISARSFFETRAYYKYSDFNDVRLSDRRHIFDLDAQHTWNITPTNTFVWGGAVRYSWDEIDNGPSITLMDPEETTSLYSAFAQLTSELLDYRLIVTGGSKFEFNDYTGFEVQPTLRALYRIDDNHKIWGAVSRAVRTPSRVEDSIIINAAVIPGTVSPPTPPTEVRVIGGAALAAESLVSVEGGYRGQFMENLTFDFAVYHHSYENLITTEMGLPFFEATPVPHAVAPQFLTNDGDAKAWGIEAAVNWQPTASLRVEFTYGYVDASIRSPESPSAQTSPYHQVAARLLYQVSDSLGLNLTARYVGLIPSSGLGDYVDLDVRAQWNLNENLDLSLIGRNLVGGERNEYEPEFVFAGGASMTRPSASIQLNWRN